MVDDAEAGGPLPSELERWTASGAAWLTGRAHGSPLAAPPALVDLVTSSFAGLIDATAGWSEEGAHPLQTIDPMALLGERAALSGLHRRGRRSCGGSTRLFRAADGWVAVALPRGWDLELVPAWLDTTLDDWAVDPAAVDVARLDDLLASRNTEELVGRAGLVGLAVGALGEVRADAPVVTTRESSGPAMHRPPMVVDLSSLWAGPLCSHLLAVAGADVVKVESVTRPDGMRHDTSGFFDLLTAGKRCVAFDIASETGVDQLQGLLAAADIIIEGSRPRALQQLGIDADSFLRRSPAKVWVSVTGHGRVGDAAMRVGFGDDAAVAGNLVAWSDVDDPCFLGDAIADPLTGLVAAAAAAQAWAAGGSRLLDIALARVAAVASRRPTCPSPALDGCDVARPRARTIAGTAPGLGQHTAEVMAEIRR